MSGGEHFRPGAALFAAVLAFLCAGARADTLPGSLALAYRNNPQLNAQRAILRATDENVPSALSGHRPSISATASLGQQFQRTEQDAGGGVAVTEGGFTPRGVGITATQTLFNGHQTGNRVRQAEQQVSAARETLRLVEQNVLLNAASAYMNLLRDDAILDLERRNVVVLEDQLRQTRDRMSYGQATRTDVSQAEARLAAGRSQVLRAAFNRVSSKATYRQVIGIEPGRLSAASPVDRLSPASLTAAIESGRARNPNVTAAMFGIDVQLLEVKINEGALLPTLTANASVQQNWDVSPTIANQTNAAIIGQLTIPIYARGGQDYASIRAAKETLTQRRLDLETARDQAQAVVTQAWGQLVAAKAQIQATVAQVTAAETALDGVREEARVGQRTTLDVLNAQQELVNARVALVTAQRDRVVASYALLAAVGRLSPAVLALSTAVYDPTTHYQQVRDSWAGVRTADGR